MGNDARKSRLVTILWFAASALAFVAVAIRYFKDREPDWGGFVLGLFCLIMGIIALARNPRPPQSA